MLQRAASSADEGVKNARQTDGEPLSARNNPSAIDAVFLPADDASKGNFADNFLLLQSQEAKDDQSINCERQTGM